MAEKGKGLQRKTKAELIDIILRKDDVHKNLNDIISKKDSDLTLLNYDIENLQKEIDNNVSTINKLQQEAIDKENSIDDFKEGFDKQAVIIQEQTATIKCLRMIIVIIIFFFLSIILSLI